LTIREETAADIESVREVNRLAFGGEIEARLVDRLRDEGLVVGSLVAVLDGVVAGHVLFSELPIETARGRLAGVALAPVAVRPHLQRRGIGSALIRAGLELCRARGCAVAVVLGHPAYYARFGFSAALAARLRAPFSGDPFMALELAPGALDGITGVVRYPDEFAEAG